MPTSEQFNRLLQERAATRPSRRDTASAAFRARFAHLATTRATLGAPGLDGLAVRPERCAFTPSGDIYLGGAGSRRIHRWRTGAKEVEALAVARAELPWDVGDLFWRDEDATLYVLDSGRHQVRRYDAEGAPLGFVALNAGQTNFALLVVDDGGLVAGGVREERPGRTTLVSLHDGAGRHRASFFRMDSAMATSKLRSAPPVLLAPAGAGEFHLAEPTSPVVHRVSSEGEVLGRIDTAFEGYRAPVPLNEVVFDFARADAWTRAWDRMVFLHATPTLVFTGFQRWRGSRPIYRIEVRTPDGAHVSSGLWHDSFPLCGRGPEIVLASQGDSREVELSRWRFHAASGRDADSPTSEVTR